MGMGRSTVRLLSAPLIFFSIWDYDPSQDEALYQGFAKIVDNGVNFFDTAEVIPHIYFSNQ